MGEQDIIAAKLDELIAATRATQAVWLDAAGVGARISETRRYVLERLAPLPDFPKPSRPGGFGQPRWKASEIDRWMERHQKDRRAA